MYWNRIKSTVKCDLNWCDNIVLTVSEETTEQSYVKLLCQLELNDRFEYKVETSSPPPFKKKKKTTTRLLQVIFAWYNRNSNSQTDILSKLVLLFYWMWIKDLKPCYAAGLSVLTGVLTGSIINVGKGKFIFFALIFSTIFSLNILRRN